MITSSYDYSLGALQTIFANKIDKEELVSYIKGVKQNKEYPRQIKILIDANTVLFDFSVEELQSIAAVHKELMDDYERIWIAFVVNSPNETALSFLYKQFAELDYLRFTILSTKENAIGWLEQVF